MRHPTLERWHRLLESQDLGTLDDLLADNAVFHSPIVHTPQEGKEITKLYLTAAYHVLGNAGFRYVREVASGDNAVLEFTANIDGIHINGVDMMHWDSEGRIDEFKVMIRPLKAINLLHRMMAEMLARPAPG